MTNSQLILIDLDRTLFDSDRFYVDICQLLDGAKIIKPDVFAQAQALLNSAARSLYLTDLIKANHLNPREVFNLVKPKLVPNAYLHADVAPFFARFANAKIQIITTGQDEYQDFKYQLSPVLTSAKMTVISELDKGAYIATRLVTQNHELGVREITPGEWFAEAYFIDDRAYNFNSLLGINSVKLYHILRKGGKRSAPYSGKGVAVINSLEEII